MNVSSSLGWLKDDVTAAYAERNLVTVINVHSADQLTVALIVPSLAWRRRHLCRTSSSLPWTPYGNRLDCVTPSRTICLKALRIVQRIPMPGTSPAAVREALTDDDLARCY